MKFSLDFYLILIASSILCSSYFVGREKIFGSGYETLINCTASVLFLSSLVINHKNKVDSVLIILMCLLLLVTSFSKGKFIWTYKSWINSIFSLLIFVLSINIYNFINVSRSLLSFCFLGCVLQAMLLGHWYLVQPGLNRKPIKNLIMVSLSLLLIYVPFFIFFKDGMLNIINGTKDDGWGGLLSTMWIGNIVLTFGLLVASYFSLKERSYTAVMATTGLLYLSIVAAYASDIIFRAI